MKTKYIDNKSENLIVFLTGWGCDDNQFDFLKSVYYDVLIIYDYSDLNLDFDFDKYKKHYLISFSAGVFMSGVLNKSLPNFDITISINGNPLAYDEYFGLREEIVQVFEGVKKENALDFRRKYLVYNEKEFKLFNANQSHRTFESCKEELIALKNYVISHHDFKFDVTILSENDKIFSPNRQKEYWNNKSKCIYLKNSAHFPFFRWKTYDEIIKLAKDTF